jgi:hypothetical protein
LTLVVSDCLVRPRRVDAVVVTAGARVVVDAGPATVVDDDGGATTEVVVVWGSTTVVVVVVGGRPRFLAPEDVGVFTAVVDVVVLEAGEPATVLVLASEVAPGAVVVPAGAGGFVVGVTGDRGPLAAAAGVAPATDPIPMATRAAAMTISRAASR